jgi:chromosome segregation ATPase
MKQKLTSLAWVALLTSAPLVLGQDTPAPVIDLEARKASVVNLESQITQREARLEEVRQDIVTIDGRIEKRMDSVVKMLADTRDSQDSKTRVSQIKMDAIKGLRRAIDMYVSKRKEVAERVKAGDDSALGDLPKFDQRISTRVAQIVELSKSFPPHEDVKKYESEGGDYWNGYYSDNTRISEEWKQNRRDNSQSKVQRDEVTAAIREGIERLDQRRRTLQDMLDNRKPSDSARKLYLQELGQIDAQLETLNDQLVQVTLPTGGATRTPSLDEAVDMEHLLDDARKDLRADVSTLFQLYDAYDKERFRVAGMKENLAARKGWLEKNAPASN